MPVVGLEYTVKQEVDGVREEISQFYEGMNTP